VAANAKTPVPMQQRFERSGKGALTVINGGADPWWSLDLGMSIPIKTIQLLGRTHAQVAECTPGYWIRVGDDPDPYTNPTCHNAELNIEAGVEVACERRARYVSVVRPAKDRLFLAAVAVFIDCDSPDLPWDPLTEIYLTVVLHQTQSVALPISLASELEALFGVDVCGELKFEVLNLPSFCSLQNDELSCSPTLDEHGGLHQFEVV